MLNKKREKKPMKKMKVEGKGRTGTWKLHVLWGREPEGD